MRIRLHPDLLKQTSAFDVLDRIARLLDTGRHEWTFDIGNLDVIENSAWLTSEPESRAGRRHRDLFQKTAKRAIEQGQARSVELDSDDPPPGLHAIVLEVGGGGVAPETALAQLEQPARLLVENKFSDGRFIQSLIRVFERYELAAALSDDRQWLVLEHCGGQGEITKNARAFLANTANRPDRMAALVDSDRLYPGHQSDTVKQARETGEKTRIKVFVLRKREAENYLPRQALENLESNRTRAVEVFFDELTDDQRDYFDMKNGFKKRKKSGEVNVSSKWTEGLFDDLSDNARQALVGGFGPGCGSQFDTDAVTRRGLEARCRRDDDPGAEDELLAILCGLEALL